MALAFNLLIVFAMGFVNYHVQTKRFLSRFPFSQSENKRELLKKFYSCTAGTHDFNLFEIEEIQKLTREEIDDIDETHGF